MLLPKEIEEGGKHALSLLNSAFEEMDAEEARQRNDPNASKKYLTSVQRNRMAINYMHMNEAPRRYKYFDRFVDKDRYEQLRLNVITGKAKEEKVLNQMKEIHTDLLSIKKSRKSIKLLKKSQAMVEKDVSMVTFAAKGN